MTAPLLEVQSVSKVFSSGFFNNQKLVAVDNVSLSLPGGQARTVALAGESGSGKTTLAQIILGFMAPTQGQVLLDGQPLSDRSGLKSGSGSRFRQVQAVFQNPFEAFNPFYTINHIFDLTIAHFRLAESRAEAKRLVIETLKAVHLDPGETLGRYPHQLSGGQLQRLMVARALLLRPRLLVADEPVSMIDVSLRAMILDLLESLKTEYGISIVYITHDLSTALQIADDMLIMYKGCLVEAGDVTAVIQQPLHPYTQLLIRSIPLPDPEQRWSAPLDIEAESSSQELSQIGTHGCKFFDRCPVRMDICQNANPALHPIDETRQVACFLFDGKKYKE